MTRHSDRKADEAMISPEDLARRWSMSRTGAIRVAERAKIPSIFLGGVERGARRFRLRDIQAYEEKCVGKL